MWTGWFESRAWEFLEALADQVGRPAVPGLTAEVDQHAAAVRDILVLGVEASATVAAAVLLAAYARGLLDQVREETGRPWAPVPGGTGWVQLRLLAVCQLARAHRVGSLTDGQPDLPSPA
ncbi:DUF6401 family natural product biosynthesis protein [Amycolatopsis nalaikhensis]|uniref:DUF6401 family natural product biosynthesis protein n=1 Tax=Amycolatopsis nalaikhensis TaxID=715472 RepID=A0ABY8Y1Q2_9PSEU|nr:DUF6401 family natural product biosynthesis protein [Amycolatopsis sp. 2-2]WIV61783.1 DUF6401 family natural product biosynthesis protein [Amycolatopsis sp. 2-2]